MNLDLVELFTSDLNWITIVVAIIVIIVSNILNTIITEKLKKEKSPSSIVKDKSIKDLQELHPIFTSLKYYRDVVLPTCRIGGPVRTIVFKDCLKIYYDTCIDECEQLLKQDITNDTFLNINKNDITPEIKFDFYCVHHQSEKFTAFCQQCLTNICEQCIKEWLKNHNFCGMCKQKCTFNDMIPVPLLDDMVNYFINNFSSCSQSSFHYSIISRLFTYSHCKIFKLIFIPAFFIPFFCR